MTYSNTFLEFTFSRMWHQRNEFLVFEHVNYKSAEYIRDRVGGGMSRFMGVFRGEAEMH